MAHERGQNYKCTFSNKVQLYINLYNFRQKQHSTSKLYNTRESTFDIATSTTMMPNIEKIDK